MAHEQLIRFHGHFIFPLSMVQRDDFGPWELQQGVPETKGKTLRMSLWSESVKAWEAKNTRYVMIQHTDILVNVSD